MNIDFVAQAATYMTISALVGAPLSFALLRLFRRSVVKGQRIQDAEGESPQARTLPERRAVAVAPSLELADRSLAATFAVYLVAAIAFTAVFAIAMVVEFGAPPSLRGIVIASLFSFATQAPVVFFVGWIVLPPGPMRTLFMGVTAALLIAMAFIVIPFSDGTTVRQVLESVQIPVIASAIIGLFMTRRVRAAGPLVLLIVASFVVGANLFVDLAWMNPTTQGLMMTAAPLIGAQGTLFAFRGIGVVLGVVLLWPLLVAAGFLYRRKVISDQSLTMDVVFLWFAIWLGLQHGVNGLIWTLSGIVAFLVYKSVTLAGFGVLTLARRRDPHSDILLLRPFALGTRSERLFDQLSKVWLRIGGVHMIAGPDLVMSTVSPPEFLTFLAGGFSRRFIRNRADLDARLAALDVEPDPDGRHRVNQLFCRDNVWKDAMRSLANRSAAVLMDLRGFTVANQGCCFEIEELIRDVPLDRVVFAVDETTDTAFLAHVAEEVRRSITAESPNRVMTDITSRLVPVDGSARGRRRLLSALMDASAV